MITTPPTLRSLCESAPPGPGVICPISPQIMLKVMDALEENTTALAFMAGAFGNQLKPEHKERNKKAFTSARESLNLLNGSTPETI